MKKNLALFLMWLILTGGIGLAKKIADLPKVMVPLSVVVHNEKIYITEERGTNIFNLSTGKFLYTICIAGEGPAEFKSPPLLTPSKNGIIAVGGLYPAKVLFLDFEGKTQKEIQINGNRATARVFPVMNNYVIKKNSFNSKKQNYNHMIGVYDGKFNLIKNLYTAEFPGSKIITSGGKKEKFNLMNDLVKYETSENKIFVCDTAKGFFIKVFKGNGDFLYDIDLKYKRIPVDNFSKKKFIDLWCKDSVIKLMKNKIQFTFPEFFPSFRNFSVNNSKIYVQTYPIKNGKNEFIIFDLKGKKLGSKYLPAVDFIRNPFYSINEGIYYYLYENEENEMWEMHEEEIG